MSARSNSSQARYGRVAQAFHWVVAILVFIQVGIGIYVDDLPLGIERIKWMTRHKAIGITILALVLLRLAWRWINPAPSLPEHLPRWQRVTAFTTHGLLYGLLVAAPIAGWLTASAAGLGVSWFGVFTVPALIEKTPGLVDTFEAWHEGLVFALALTVLLHVGAAIWHAWHRDGVMSRMLPWHSNRSDSRKEDS
ncbi:MAG: cytochrome b [Gammaproteobacteria bacterium]|nr:cytochrome b [Gammaproteobacteria bacterium]